MKPALILLAALALPAAAQTVYKCTVDGKVSYNQTPCPAGAASSELAAPSVPDPATVTDPAREKWQADALEKERLEREAQQDRALAHEARAIRAGNAHDKRCAKLKADKIAADEKAKTYTIKTEAAVRARAQRAADALAQECS